MKKIGFCVVIALLVLASITLAQSGFVVRGRIGATDQESQEGYYAIDSETMIVVKPGSDFHNYLRSKVGQHIRITIEPDTESN